MQYDVDTPEAYLDALEDDWRKATLLELRTLILDAGLIEGIGYKMLRYSDGDAAVFHLNAQKAHVGLYAGKIDAADPDGSLLAGLSLGKGCVRFSKSKKAGDTGVGQFILNTLERVRGGDDVGC